MASPQLTSPRSGRVVAARKLVRRGGRVKERRFLAEGPQAVREAAAHGAPGPERTLVELFATTDAAERYRDILAAASAAGAAVHLATDDAVGSLSQTVTPQGLVGVCRFLDTPFDQV